MAASVVFDAQPGGKYHSFPRKVRHGTVTLGSSYTTNGVAVTPALFGLGRIDDLSIQPSGGYTFEYLPATGKIKAYWQRDSNTTTYDKVPLTEIDNATSMTSITPRFRAEGI